MYDPAGDACWRPEDLGRPVPDDEHAVSVCLPLWRHNIGYEEADPQVVNAMQCGYPRFFLHPLTRRLFALAEKRFAGPNECCLVLPSERVARRCAEFIHRQTSQPAAVHELAPTGLFAVCLPAEARSTAVAYWQHTGEIVSSRRAQAALNLLETGSTGDGGTERPGGQTPARVRTTLRERVAALTGSDPADVYLFPNGMAAVFTAYRVLQRMRPEGRSVQFGFPYVDILKIQQRFARAGQGVHFFPNGDASELEELQRALQTEQLVGLFCEFPGNPLLGSPDLGRLVGLARDFDFPLVVDDTIGAFVNVDVAREADLLAASLTKYFSGRGDVMGGSLVLGSNGRYRRQLRALLEEEYEDLLPGADAAVLEFNSRDFSQRIRKINQTAEQLCDHLRRHPAVERVYYPKYQTPENFAAYRKPGGGFGGLFSLLLRNAAETAPAFFDALEISKGPNLGTNFSLCCPYTILAHYNELDFAERCGISRYLLRVSVGLEEPGWLVERFERALEQGVMSGK